MSPAISRLIEPSANAGLHNAENVDLEKELADAEFLKIFCNVPSVMRRREQQGSTMSKAEKITDDEKKLFGIWMRAELKNIKNFDCKFNFDEKTQKLIDEMDRRIKTIERNPEPKYYTYAIQTHAKEIIEPKINFGKGSTIRTPFKILLASLLESKIEDLRRIQDKTSGKISQAIRSNHEIKMIILEKKLPEDRSLAYETLRLEWLFETVEEENNMNTEKTSYDLNRLNMERSKLNKIRDDLIKKYQRLAEKTPELDIATCSSHRPPASHTK